MEEIIKQLLKEIKSLKQKRGFLNAGLPGYNRLFGRDSLISAWQLLDIDAKICKETLKILSKLQGKKIDKEKEEEPGKILHETDLKNKYHPEIPGFPFPYYGSVDSTPLFLILFGFFFKKTKDKGFLKKYFENILLAVNWMMDYGDKDQDLFLEYERKNPQGLYHQGWKDSTIDHLKIKAPVAIVEVQGYQYLALKETSEVFRVLGEENLSKSLFKRAKKLKDEFNKKFWMPKEKFFALALDDKKNQKKSITSNPGHLLFSGIINEGKTNLIVKRLFQPDLWTPYGIRTHATLEPDFNPKSYHLGSIWPQDNWIIAQGLKKLGCKKEYEKIKKALFNVYQKLGFIPEFYTVIEDRLLEIEGACYPQAWASGAVLNFVLKS